MVLVLFISPQDLRSGIDVISISQYSDCYSRPTVKLNRTSFKEVHFVYDEVRASLRTWSRRSRQVISSRVLTGLALSRRVELDLFGKQAAIRALIPIWICLLLFEAFHRQQQQFKGMRTTSASQLVTQASAPQLFSELATMIKGGNRRQQK
ncbi:unnamed protein product [Polarella glacialis]|uniref:Uncharacterized protein n=1 Tax=Polarella glacialis TaxID=89957 RepID=A0A813IEW9_POLGL|nr:unnamed protein product [Polarella glacialis]